MQSALNFQKRTASPLLVALFLIIAYLLVVELNIFKIENIGIDDAQIFFVYARNAIAGHGLRWFPGELPVEGYSSPVWLAICIVAFGISQNPEIFLLFFNIFILIAAGKFYIGSWQIIDQSPKLVTRYIPYFFVLWILSDPGFILWNVTSLMDCGIWSASIMFATGLLFRRAVFPKNRAYERSLYLCISLLPWVRSEGIIISCLVVALLVFIGGRLREEPSSRNYNIFTCTLVLLLSVTIITTLRMSYFGLPLPNTFYAKQGSIYQTYFSQGLFYLKSYAFDRSTLFGIGVVLSSILTSVAFILYFKKAGNKQSSRAQLWIVINSPIYFVMLFTYFYLGGDHFPLWRQYQAVFPLFFSLLFTIPYLFNYNCTLKYCAHFSSETIILNSYIVLIVSIGLSNWYDTRAIGSFKAELELARVNRELGRSLNSVFSSDGSYPEIAALSIGGLAFSYSGHVIDLMGLTNTKMSLASDKREGLRGHSAFRTSIFWKLTPNSFLPISDFCNLNNAKFTLKHPFSISIFHELFAQQRFSKHYIPIAITNPMRSDQDYSICLFFERSSLKKFKFEKSYLDPDTLSSI